MSYARLTIIPFLLFCSMSSFPATQQEQTSRPVAVKFADFGDILYSDLIARLDNFAIQLMNQPNTIGFIVVYRTRRDLPGLSHALAMRSKRYLVQPRGIPNDRVETVDGGIADHLAQELWIVPPGTAPVPRPDSRIGYLQNPDAAWKFYEHAFLPLDEDKRFGYHRNAETEAEELEAYVSEVKKSPERIACIIVYAQYNPRRPLADWSGSYEPRRERALDPRGTARKELNRQRNYLMRVFGLAPTRLKLIDGGYRKRRWIEFWIVPSGEPLPIPTPNAFPFRGRKRGYAASFKSLNAFFS